MTGPDLAANRAFGGESEGLRCRRYLCSGTCIRQHLLDYPTVDIKVDSGTLGAFGRDGEHWELASGATSPGRFVAARTTWLDTDERGSAYQVR